MSLSVSFEYQAQTPSPRNFLIFAVILLTLRSTASSAGNLIAQICWKFQTGTNGFMKHGQRVWLHRYKKSLPNLPSSPSISDVSSGRLVRTAAWSKSIIAVILALTKETGVKPKGNCGEFGANSALSET